MRRVVLLLAIKLGANAIAAESGDWRFAPPDAQFFAGIEWKRVSGEMGGLLKQAGVSNPRSLTFLSRLERISLAVAVRGDQAEMVALLEGGFTSEDAQELARSAGLQPGRIGSLQKMSAAGRMGIVVLGPRHILMGDDRELKAAVARLKEPASGLPLALEQAAPALRSGDFWLIGSLPKEFSKAAGELVASLKPIGNPLTKPGRATPAVVHRPVYGRPVSFPEHQPIAAALSRQEPRPPQAMVIHGLDGGPRRIAIP
jgi:hypothetical protein